MNKITFAIVLGIAVVGAMVRADEKVTYRDSIRLERVRDKQYNVRKLAVDGR